MKLNNPKCKEAGAEVIPLGGGGEAVVLPASEQRRFRKMVAYSRGTTWNWVHRDYRLVEKKVKKKA